MAIRSYIEERNEIWFVVGLMSPVSIAVRHTSVEK